MAPFGHSGGPLSHLFTTLGVNPGALRPLRGKRLEQGTEDERNEDPNIDIFINILRFCGNFQEVVNRVWIEQARAD